jgi:hypothetical protein
MKSNFDSDDVVLLENLVDKMQARVTELKPWIAEKSTEYLLKLRHLEREDPPTEEEILDLLKKIGYCIKLTPGGSKIVLIQNYQYWENIFIGLYSKPCPFTMEKAAGIKPHPDST